MTSNSFRTGIIAQTEGARLRFLNDQRRWWSRMGERLFKALFGFWGAFLLGIVVLKFLSPSGFHFPGLFYLPLAILVFSTIAVHFVVVYHTLVIASESVMRERRGKTWDTLIATTIDARHLVLGKWWASIAATWRAFAMLSLIRAGAMIAGVYLLEMLFYSFLNPALVVPGALRLICGGVLITVFTFLNLVLTAAAGVVGGLLTDRADGVAVPKAQAVRMVALLVPGVTVLVVGIYLAYAPSGPRISLNHFQWLAWLVIILLDNGTLVAVNMVDPFVPGHSPFDPNTLIPVITALTVIIIYVALTFVLLAIAQYLAQRQGILPPAKAPESR